MNQTLASFTLICEKKKKKYVTNWHSHGHKWRNLYISCRGWYPFYSILHFIDGSRQYVCILCGSSNNATLWLNCNSIYYAWWRHQMETFSALLAICAGNSPVRWIPRTKARDAELCCLLWSASEKKWLSKQPWSGWFETPSWSLWRHCNGESDYIQQFTVRCNYLCSPYISVSDTKVPN